MRVKVLVTGAAGFVGRHLVRYLVVRGFEVWGLDLQTRAATGWDEVRELCQSSGGVLLHGDVRDPEHVQFRAKFRHVFHLAAESHVDESLRDPQGAFSTNAVGTSLVAAECTRRGASLCYVSTDEVYGDRYGEVFSCAREDAAIHPSSPYSAGKAAGEMAVHGFVRSFGLEAVIVRGSNAFGPGQYAEKLVPIACRLLNAGERVPLHGGGKQIRQFLHVEEFAEGIALAGLGLWRSSVPGLSPMPIVLNLAGPRRCSVRELVRHLANRLLWNPDLPYVSIVADRPGQDRVYGVVR